MFARDGAGVRFWPAPVLQDLDVAEVLAAIVPRVRRVRRHGGLISCVAMLPIVLPDVNAGAV
jgi:hypothetical protein